MEAGTSDAYDVSTQTAQLVSVNKTFFKYACLCMQRCVCVSVCVRDASHKDR